MKKVGWLLLSSVPMLAMVALQIIIAMVIVFAVDIVVAVMFVSGGGTDFNALNAQMTGLATNKTVLFSIIVVYQVTTLLIAGIVYYFACKERKIENPIKCVGIKGIPLLMILFAGCEVFTGCLLVAAQFVIPGVMQDYADMIESSGMGDLSFLSTLSTVIMAPLAEELVFRGITFKMARKFTSKFWIANIIQALMFGIAHMNLVQGAYAFLLGLVLGLIYKKYNSLYATMIGHLVFNFTGTYLVAPLFGAEDTELSILRLCILVVGSLICIVAGILLISKDKKSKERVMLFNERYANERMPKSVKVAACNVAAQYGEATVSSEEIKMEDQHLNNEKDN